MKKITFISFALFASISINANADNYKVYKPIVEEGEFSAESNINFSSDHRQSKDNYLSHVDGFEYGVTDYWKMELSGEFEKEDDQNTRLTNLKWENIFVPFKHGENWVDTGFYIEVEKALQDDLPNNLEGKLLLQKDFGKWSNTANLILGHNFGPHSESGLSGAVAWQTTYKVNDMFQPGFEYYGDFGKIKTAEVYEDQDHKLGPIVEGQIGEFSYNTGALFGISRGAQDLTIKLNLEYEF